MEREIIYNAMVACKKLLDWYKYSPEAYNVPTRDSEIARLTKTLNMWADRFEAIA